MRRKKMSRKASKRSFAKGTKVNKRNNVRIMRGGYRI